MPNPTAAMLVIGDEILSGRTKDKNVGFLAENLTRMAIDLKEARVVSDDHADIVAAITALSKRWDFVFTSGGIGPTHDDITADAVADAFNTPIDVRADAKAILVAHYKVSGVALNEARLRMARIPDGATLIENPISAAPGFVIKNVHVMAGVPAIFQAMVESVLPNLTGGQKILSKTVRLNRPEGDIAQRLTEFAAENSAISIGSYPFFAGGSYGSNIVFRTPDQRLLDETIADFLTQFSDLIE